MKRTLIATSVGALFAVAAGSALALNPSTTAAVTASNQIRSSGATAQDPGVLAILRRSCAAGSLDAYAFTGGNAQTVYSCTLSTAWTDGANTIPSGTNIVLFKDSAVGSQNGISPFTTGGTGIQFVTLSSLAGSCTTVATVAASGSLIAYNSYSCGSSPSLAAAVTPDIGFSDVEPKIFGYDPASVTGAAVGTANQLIFGVPVSQKLYAALQTAQGITGRPSLSRSQIAGLYSGNLADAESLGITTNPTETVYIVRRPGTSGTQKAAEINFLQQNVVTPAPTAFVLASLTAPTSTVTSNANYANLTAGCGVGTTPPTAGRVFAGNGSGDVRNCLNFHGTNRLAVGVLSLEANESGANWKWARINDAAPTIYNVIKGTYEHWVEQAILLSNSASARAQAAYGQIKADLSNPAYIPSLNASFTVFSDEPAGRQATGIVALPELLTGLGTGACHDRFAGSVTADNDPVNISTKSASGEANSAVNPAIAICKPRHY